MSGGGKIKTSCVAVVLAIVMAVGHAAVAGPLATDPLGIAGFTGTAVFNDGFTNASVDYAVYNTGDFESSALFSAGDDPSGGTEHVYAYQIENIGSFGVTGFTIALDANEPLGAFAGSPGFVSGAGLVDPNNTTSPPRFAGVPPTSVKWDFTPVNLNTGQTSAFLIFTSAAPPEFDTATVDGILPVTLFNSIPSPNETPEPATLSLLALGSLTLLRRRRGLGTAR